MGRTQYTAMPISSDTWWSAVERVTLDVSTANNFRHGSLVRLLSSSLTTLGLLILKQEVGLSLPQLTSLVQICSLDILLLLGSLADLVLLSQTD